MIAILRTALLFVGFQMILLFYTGSISPQINPNALIGTWEGKAERVPGFQGRTIIIRSVKSKGDGNWVATGNFGFTGGKVGPQVFDVSLRNEELVISFVTIRKNPVQLVLKSDNKLEGTLEWSQPSSTGVVQMIMSPLELEKVASKTSFARLDPARVLIGRWEGRIEDTFKGRNDRTLIILSIKPSETGWIAAGRFFLDVGGHIAKGINVSMEDGSMVLQFNTYFNDSVRLVLTGDNRLEGTLEFAHYRGTGIIVRRHRLIFQKKGRPRAPGEASLPSK